VLDPFGIAFPDGIKIWGKEAIVKQTRVYYE